MLLSKYIGFHGRYKYLLLISTGFYVLSNPVTTIAGPSLKDPFGVIDEAGNKVNSPSCNSVDIKNEINLINAIDVALCNNPQTASSWAVAKASAANLGEARGNYLPTVMLNGDLARNYSDRTSVGSNPSSYNSSSTGLDLSYLIYDFGGRESAVESAKQQMFQNSFNYNSLIQSMVFQVIKAYLDVFTATESLDAAITAENASKEAFEVAKAKERVGLVTKADTAQAETAYSQNVLETERAANALKLANGSFSVLLHLSPTYKIRLAQVEPEKIGQPLSGDIENYIKQALDNRPDLASSISREKQFEADLRNADAANYPVISVTGAVADTNYSNGTDRTQNDSSVRLNLSMPLFTGFKNTYKKLAAKNALDSARSDRTKTEDDIKLDVWNSYHNYQTSQQTYETSKVLIRSAEASEALALGRYKVGKGTLTDALDAQAKLADARRQWVQARYDTLITRFDLLRALGSEEWQKHVAPVISKRNPNYNVLPTDLSSAGQENYNTNDLSNNIPATTTPDIIAPKMNIILPAE